MFNNISIWTKTVLENYFFFSLLSNSNYNDKSFFATLFVCNVKSEKTNLERSKERQTLTLLSITKITVGLSWCKKCN